MSGDAVLVLAIVGLLLLEATNYAFGGDRLVVAQAWAFMVQRKKWWLVPIAVMLALLGLLVMLPLGKRRLAVADPLLAHGAE